MQFVTRFLKSSPFPSEISDYEEVKEKYRYWRVRVMYSMFLGYVFYYFTRKSFVFAMPSMMEEFGLEKWQLGLIGTIFSLTYGISKFLSGVWSDQSNPKYFMSIGLILTGVANIFFGLSSSLLFFAFFWGLNAWFQGFGWPPCVKLLSNWYSRSERGSWWSIWSISHNVGGALAPWIVALSLTGFGWRGAMFIPGVLSILGGLVLLNRLPDVPRSLGLPPVEKYRKDESVEEKIEPERVLSGKALMQTVFRNKSIWMLAAAYFFVYFIRTGMGDWMMFFMMEAKGYSRIGAGGIASLFEIGGFFGGVSAGWLSDRLFGAKRGPVNALYILILFLTFTAFWLVPGGYLWVDSAMIFLIGFATFGPQMLIGVAVAELAHKQAGATATGLASWIAYLGSALAGIPLGYLLDRSGWNGFFLSMTVSSCCALLFLFPLWNKTKAGASLPERTSS